MIETMSMQTQQRVTVVGGGFSGLTAAHYLNAAGWDVTLIERAAATGGLIATRRTPWGLAETAASSALNSALFEQFAADIGLELLPAQPIARRRFVWRDGRARRLPLKLRELPALAVFLLRALVDRDRVAPQAGECLRDWALRVAGPGFTHYLIEAMMQGIYAGNPEQLSATLTVGRVFARTPRPPRPRYRGVTAPAAGMGMMVDGLRDHLLARGVVIQTSNSYAPSSFSHPHVIATGPADAAALLEGHAPALAAALRRIELMSMVTATLFFDEPVVHGFGCLFPPLERMPMLGVLINSDVFANRSEHHAAETWMLGGAPGTTTEDPHALAMLDDAALVEFICRQRQRLFARSERPAGYSITRWPRTLPHYDVKLERLIPELEAGARNVVLHGNYLGQLGLAKILERSSRLPERLRSLALATG